jgi:DNA repair protein RadC
VNLKGDNTPINCHIASIGAVNQTMAHPRELLKSSILSNAANIILLHNHPSKNLHPSKEDTMLTDRMLKITELIGIPLLDHIIVGGDNSEYFSFKAKGLLKNPIRVRGITCRVRNSVLQSLNSQRTSELVRVCD